MNDDCEWVRLPGVFRLSEFAHVTDFDRHFHAEPAWEYPDGEPVYRIYQRIDDDAAWRRTRSVLNAC